MTQNLEVASNCHCLLFFLANNCHCLIIMLDRHICYWYLLHQFFSFLFSCGLNLKAFMKAWEAFCGASEDAPILTVPAGYTFLLHQSTIFKGPCQSSTPHIQVHMIYFR